MQCTRDMVSSGRASSGEAMVAARRVITLSIDPDQCCALANIARSRTEATGRVERARIILAYLAIREICAGTGTVCAVNQVSLCRNSLQKPSDHVFRFPDVLEMNRIFSLAC